jgi:hypothetical protein
MEGGLKSQTKKVFNKRLVMGFLKTFMGVKFGDHRPMFKLLSQLVTSHRLVMGCSTLSYHYFNILSPKMPPRFSSCECAITNNHGNVPLSLLGLSSSSTSSFLFVPLLEVRFKVKNMLEM